MGSRFSSQGRINPRGHSPRILPETSVQAGVLPMRSAILGRPESQQRGPTMADQIPLGVPKFREWRGIGRAT